jgi:hypothetical protein
MKAIIIKKFVIIAGIALGLVFAGFFFQVWLEAYQNKYQVIVTVNQVGEARVELFLFPIFMLIMVISLVIAIIELRRGMKIDETLR